MVGLDSGLVRTHARANVMADITSVATWGEGGGIRWSTTSFNNMFSPPGDDKEEMRSAGCFPTITSNATTPKL